MVGIGNRVGLYVIIVVGLYSQFTSVMGYNVDRNSCDVMPNIVFFYCRQLNDNLIDVIETNDFPHILEDLEEL